MPADWKRPFFIYATVIAVGMLGAISDAALNQWAKTNKFTWLLAAYGTWIMVATALGIILKFQYFSFSSAVVLFLLANTAGAIFLDHKLYSGRLSVWEWTGIALAIVAMCCIEFGRGQGQIGE